MESKPNLKNHEYVTTISGNIYHDMRNLIVFPHGSGQMREYTNNGDQQ
jgi:hypothetical protein